MSHLDLDPERVLRALRVRLRTTGVPAALRPRILRRAGVILRVDHALVEQILEEPPLSIAPQEEEPHLYEVLLEAAIRSNTLDELDMLLRLGGEVAVGVDAKAHGQRVAEILKIPRTAPPSQRSGADFGQLRDLFSEEDVLRLGSEHGPSSPCPSCRGYVRLTSTQSRRETSRGVLSTHAFRCTRCRASGTLDRFFSHRLRGNQDRPTLAFPGLLGFLASRTWCRRGALVFLGLALVLLGTQGTGVGALHLALVLAARSRVQGAPGELAVGFLGPLSALVLRWLTGSPEWYLLALIESLVTVHVWVMLGNPPLGWQK